MIQVVAQKLNAQIEAGSIELPLLPKVVADVLALVNDPESTAQQLSALIHRDQALAAHVLRVGNSAAYGGRGRITSLQQAVTRLGMRVLAEIAITLGVVGVFRVRGFENEIAQMWNHSLASAAYGKEIARIMRHNVEAAFLDGLLHGIGRPVVLPVINKIARNLNGELAREDVFRLIGAFHTKVGVGLARAWKLPSHVEQSIAYNARWRQAPGRALNAQITCLAALCGQNLLDEEKLTEERLRGNPVIAELNLYPDQIDALLSRKPKVREMVESFAK